VACFGPSAAVTAVHMNRQMWSFTYPTPTQDLLVDIPEGLSNSLVSAPWGLVVHYDFDKL
jgi:hypothetical protein